MSKDVLQCYDEADVGEVASALLTTSFGSRVVGNLYLKLTGKSTTFQDAKRKPPVKIFTKRADAEKWLLEQIAEAKK